MLQRIKSLVSVHGKRLKERHRRRVSSMIARGQKKYCIGIALWLSVCSYDLCTCEFFNVRFCAFAYYEFQRVQTAEEQLEFSKHGKHTAFMSLLHFELLFSA